MFYYKTLDKMATMGHADRDKLVFTVKDKCRVCYTCVRECPVKAIKIINGQAEVLSERCIGCGNCVTVCSQNAKEYFNSINILETLLRENNKVVALIAPSFPAEFSEFENYKKLLGMVRKLGFYKVMDVAFGADLVAGRYKKIMGDGTGKSYISSDCPAMVFFIEHFHPALVGNLAPLASPMVAMARVARHKYGQDVKVVFVGPCIAKKAESCEVDEAITFVELRQLFEKNNIISDEATPSDFDGPHAGKGSIFPISRGLLQTVNKTDDIVEGKIIVASGKNNFKEVIKEFERGEIANTNLELLCCNGCIMGAGMSEKNKEFFKRAQISKFVKQKLEKLDHEAWEKDVQLYETLDLSQKFSERDRRYELPEDTEIEKVLNRMGKTSPADYLNCGACGYETCIEHAIAVINGLAETEMCLPYTIEKLHKSIDEVNLTNVNLANTKQALKQSEKLAHMGQLSAGIAHELNNPLGVITMYSNLLLEEIEKDNVMAVDLKLIVEHANRCKNIVNGLLNFARKNQTKPKLIDIVEFTNHSLESVVVPSNIKTVVNTSSEVVNAMMDYEQMMQVFTNLEKNAIEAMSAGGSLTIDIKENEHKVDILFTDTGTGISEENMEKLFTPFFTTKETGKGTGLGLSLIYGIIKMHNGKISVTSNNNPAKGQTGTTFKLSIQKTI